MTRMLISTAAIVLVLYAALATAAWFGQRRLIYLPFGAAPPPASVGLSNAEPVVFPTDDGLELHGWFVPATGESAGTKWGPSPSGPTAIVFNGNGGNRAHRATLATALSARGIATLLFDYRGYGGNEGAPSEEGLASDARAARAYVASRPDVAADDIVYFGESLGSGVAVRLAIEHTPRVLILRSPFTSLADVGAYHYPILPVRWLLRDRFPSIGRIPQLAVPLLVIAASRDRIVPLAFSRRLFDAAPEPKAFVTIDGADHNDAELFGGTEMLGAIERFLAEHPSRR